MIRYIFVSLAFLGLITASCSAWAELHIQNAQYKPNKGVLYVKGKIKGDSVSKVYVLNAESRKQIGAIATHSRGQQFAAEIPVGSSDQVPCVIEVQTQKPSPFSPFSPFASSGSTISDYTMTTVSHAPKHCSS